VVKSLTHARVAVLVAACLGVLALPGFLLWNLVRPAPWDSQTLRIRFESVRYQTAALVFTYSVENRAWRSLRLVPEQTEIRMLQAAGAAPAGFPSFPVLLLEGHSSQRVELRIDLPAEPAPAHRQPLSDENTRRVLEQAVPGITTDDAPVSPLPLRGPVSAAQPPPEVPAVDGIIEDALRTLDGFELVDPAKGVRLLFPRGW
jgi:hypothetical protein